MITLRVIPAGFMQAVVFIPYLVISAAFTLPVLAQDDTDLAIPIDDLFVLEFSVARAQALLYEPIATTLTWRSIEKYDGKTIAIPNGSLPSIQTDATGIWGAIDDDQAYVRFQPFSNITALAYVADTSEATSRTLPLSQTTTGEIWPWNLIRVATNKEGGVSGHAMGCGTGVFRFYVECPTLGRKTTLRSNIVEVEVVYPTGQDAAAVDFLQERVGPGDISTVLVRTPLNWQTRGPALEVREELLQRFPDSVYADYVRCALGLSLCRLSEDTRAQGLAMFARAARYEWIPWLDATISGLAADMVRESADLETAVRLFRILHARHPNGEHTRSACRAISFAIMNAEGPMRPHMTAQEILELYPEE